jgi:tetratricopeptide (TPR) repeat protein
MSQRAMNKAAESRSSGPKSSKKAQTVQALKRKVSSGKTKPTGKKRTASKAAAPVRAPSKKKAPKAAAKKGPAIRKAAPKAAKKSTKKAAPPSAKKQSAVKTVAGKKAAPKRAAKKTASTSAVPKKVEEKRAHAADKPVSSRRRAAAREQRRGADDSVAARKAAAAQAALKAAERQAAEKQAGHYGKAVSHFNNRRFKRALPWFAKALEGPNTNLRHRAEVHSQICRRQIESNKVKLKTVDDYYNYGIRLVNDRQLEEAERHFQKALKMAPNGDHLHYAFAVVRALSGDAEGASANLKRAIELNGRNRLLARNDPDFSSIVRHPLITELLQP